MRAVTYQTIEQGVAELLGWDPDNLSTPEFNQIKRAVTRALEEIWRDWEWPGLCVIEQRQYVADYAAATTYAAEDQVYHIGSQKYYVALKTTLGNAPATNSGAGWETNEAYWAELARSYAVEDYSATTTYAVGDRVRYAEDGETYQMHTAAGAGTGPANASAWGLLPVFQPVLPLVQTGFTAVGDVLGAYAADPRKFAGARPVGWRLVPEGVEIFDDTVPRPWLHYLKRPHRFTGAAWSASATYTAASDEEITGSVTTPATSNVVNFAGIQAAVTGLSGDRELTVYVLGDDIGSPNTAGTYSYIPDAVVAALGLTLTDNGFSVRDTQSGEGWLLKVS